MDIKTGPRHSRQGFFQRVSSANLATALAKSNQPSSPEIIDFSPSTPRAKFMRPARLIRHISDRARTLRLQAPSSGSVAGTRNLAAEEAKAKGEAQTKFLERLAAEITSIRPIPLKSLVVPSSTGNEKISLAAAQNSRKSSFSRHSSHRLNIFKQTLPCGTRVEQFDNGSISSKDALGRVIEISSGFGDCLYLSYDNKGELCSFTRTNSKGVIHSSGKKAAAGITVRDRDGRVKAIGEFMTIDPWGRLYLHTNEGQYFCLDLIAGIHCERRRIVNSEGKISFLTAAFAHDGFRMATVYARTLADKAQSRAVLYRFYGRDGSVVEFQSEDELKDLQAARSTPAACLAVHETWMRCRQAHTAWDSVREYLSRVS